MPGPAAVAAALVLAAAGLAGCAGGTHPTTVRASSAAASATPRPSADHAAGFRSPRTHPTVAPPARLRIPAIGVDTPLMRLGLGRSGAVQTPPPWKTGGLC